MKLLLCLLAGTSLILTGCTWVVGSAAIQGEYASVDGSTIVLRDGSGTLSTEAGTRELTYTLSDQASPWIILVLEDGATVHLQYRRPGHLTYYDAFGGSVDFLRRAER